MFKKFIYTLLVLVGLLQSIGFIIKSKEVRGLGMASASSPLPIVFTEVKGVETFASNFYVSYNTSTGEADTVQITPTIYSQLNGPYNRRNVYGAAISYAPVLPDSLRTSVLQFGLCEGTLLEELGIPSDAKNVSIIIRTRTAGRNQEWIYQVDCNEE